MNELIAKIEQWAEDRNLIKGSTPLDQSMKLFSEFGELADAVAKDDLEGIKDGIGDVFVVLTIMAKQTESDIDILEVPNLENLHLKQYIIELGFCLNNFSFGCDTSGETNSSLSIAIMTLKRISAKYYLTLQKCVQHAYNDIKDRKGIMHNGVFIKESDPRYAELVK